MSGRNKRCLDLKVDVTPNLSEIESIVTTAVVGSDLRRSRGYKNRYRTLA